MELSKWNSNHPNIASCEREMPLKAYDKYVTKTLVTSWKPKHDRFCFESQDLSGSNKNIYIASRRIFDVLGLLSPIVISCWI